MATFINRGMTTPSTYYRPPTYVPPAPRPDIRDDYERTFKTLLTFQYLWLLLSFSLGWYTESVPNNRMSLSIRSGIHSEVNWALDRLCRLVLNDRFLFSSLPGIIDGLYDWPEWYVMEGYKDANDTGLLFSTPPDKALQRQFALESLFVLRNAAFQEENAIEMARHSHTVPLILKALHNLDHTRDENAEALLHIIDIFAVLGANFIVRPTTPPHSNPIPGLLQIVSESTNRTMIISSLTALTAFFSNPANATNLQPSSPALAASMRYLPLFVDKPLIDACLNYMYTHLSHPSMARAFLLHTEMPSVLKILASLLLQEQRAIEKVFTTDVTGPIHTAPSTSLSTRDHELTKEELDALVGKAEPLRCYDWWVICSLVDEMLFEIFYQG